MMSSINSKVKVHPLKISSFTIQPLSLSINVGDRVQFYVNPSDKNVPKKAIFKFVFSSGLSSIDVGFLVSPSWTSPPFLSPEVLTYREINHGSEAMSGTIIIRDINLKTTSSTKTDNGGSESVKLSSSAKRRAKLARRKARNSESGNTLNMESQKKTNEAEGPQSVSPTSLTTLELLKEVRQQQQCHETKCLLTQVQEQIEDQVQQPEEDKLVSLSHHEVIVKQGRFDPCELLVQGGSSVTWTVSMSVVGSVRLLCGSLDMGSPAIAPGSSWTCSFPKVTFESSGVVLNTKTGEYEVRTVMEDQVFLGKCAVTISNPAFILSSQENEDIEQVNRKKEEPVQEQERNEFKMEIDELKGKNSSKNSPGQSSYCSDSSFADSEDDKEHPAVASRYNGMPPQLARVALMGSFGGGGLILNAGAAKSLSEMKVSLPPRYSSKHPNQHRISPWRLSETANKQNDFNDEDSDSFEEDMPGSTFKGELSHRKEADDFFPTREQPFKYGNLIFPSALDLSPLTSPESTPAHSPDRRKKVTSAPSSSSALEQHSEWEGYDMSDPSTLAAAAAVASVLVRDSHSATSAPSTHQNLPGLPFRSMVTSSRNQSRARRVRVYEDSEGTADSDDASSLSSAATPVRTPPATSSEDDPYSLYRHRNKFQISPLSGDAVSKDILTELYMAHMKTDETKCDEENKQKEDIKRNATQFNVKEGDENDDDDGGSGDYRAHISMRGALTTSLRPLGALQHYVEDEGIEETPLELTLNQKEIIEVKSTIVKNEEECKHCVDEQAKKKKKKKGKKKKKKKQPCMSEDISHDSCCEEDAEQFADHATQVKEQGQVENFDNAGSDEEEQGWVKTSRKRKGKKTLETTIENATIVENSDEIRNKPAPPRVISQFESEVELYFSGRYEQVVSSFHDTGMDAFPGGKQVPVEVIGCGVPGFCG